MSILVNILLGLLARLFMLEDDADIPRPQVGGSPPCFFFLLDNSGSMDRRDARSGSLSRREAARKAAEGSARYISNNASRAVVGIAAYADHFYHVVGPIVGRENLEAIVDGLQDLGSTGDTAIGRGLRGIQKMVEKCPAESRKTLIVLSDGRQNEGEKPVPVARELRQQHDVDIHTIGIGKRSKVDEERLRRIASSPDQYTFLENWDPDGLLEEFKSRIILYAPQDEE